MSGVSSGGQTAHRPGQRLPWRRELTIWLALVGFYFALTSIDWAGRHEAAVANSRWLFDLERSWGVDIELALNDWLVPRVPLRVAANYEYALTYLVSSFGLLVWLYLRRPETYRWARTSFIVLNVVSLVCFAIYPVAPPRMVADLGFIDTVVLDGTWGSWGSPLTSHVNQLAAMPSLHTGWALWVSLILASIASGWLPQAVSGLHVLVTLLVIMATANHYLIDAVGGALLALACVGMARPRVQRRGRWVAATAALRRRPGWSAGPQVGRRVVRLGAEETPVRDGAVHRPVEGVVRRQAHELPRLRQRHLRPPHWHSAPGRPPRAVLAPARRRAPATPAARAGDRGHTRPAADRPLWRVVVVRRRDVRRPAVIKVGHHAVADASDLIGARSAESRSGAAG
jgi:hypothetical protein